VNRFRGSVRIILIALLVTVAGLPVAAPAGRAAGASDPGLLGILVGTPAAQTFSTTVPPSMATCSEQRLPAAMQPGLPPSFTIAGTLCVPVHWADGEHAVDVLVPGAMYNRMYWDWPLHPELYSYARRTVQAGRAAFFYDRFGTGASSHPTGMRASFTSDVYGLHQIVQWLRGDYPGVNVIGHSLGSVVVTQEAGQYQDVDHVVVTGLTHGHGLGFLTLPTAIYTALLDPQFTGMITLLDGGYLTTLPGKRAGLFYSPSADPAVIAYDEAHKDVMTGSQTAEAIVELTLPAGLNVSNQIAAPVLMVVGQQDAPFCGVDVSCVSDATLRAHEAPYFTGAQSFTVNVIPNTGHDLPLHPSAGQSFDMISDWLVAN
jgi:pimeloyl-ACP methyl ester carboxylesterase